MPNKLADDIRRIVGYDPNKESLDEFLKREGIRGLRGIGYPATGSNVGGTGGAGGPSDTTNTNSYTGPAPYDGPAEYTGPGDYAGPEEYLGPPPASLDDASGLSSTGSTSEEGYVPVSTGDIAGLSASNPYSMITSIDNLTDVENLLDLVAEQSKLKYPEFSNYNSLDYTPGGDILNGMSDMVDLVSGKAFDLRLDSGRIGFPPPDGWEDAETPPPAQTDPTFQSGYYWDHSSAGVTEFFQTPTAAHSAYMTAINNNPSGNVFEDMGVDAVSESLYQSKARQIADSNGPVVPPGPIFTVDINRVACTGGDPSGPGDYCSTIPPEIPSPEFWPTNAEGKFLVGVNEKGQFVSSQYDPHAPTGAQVPSTKKDFSFAGGTRYGSIEITKNGGHMIYESSTASGPPSGTLLIYDAAGQLVGAADAATADTYRP